MIFIGTSGFRYSEWRGIFYPDDLQQNRWLEYYSKFFNAVEINSTFYRLPVKSSFKSYVRTAPKLKYVLKLYRGITHYGSLDSNNFTPFFEAADILGSAFLGVIAQFPFRFSFSEKRLDFIRIILEKLDGMTLFVELRSPSWAERLSLLKDDGVTVCCVDAPESLGWLDRCFPTDEFAYFRFHGKRKLYSDSYSENELVHFRDIVNSTHSENKLIFFNNTSKGFAVNNALRLKDLLTG